MKWLLSRSPGFFGIAYLAMLPIFGGLYTVSGSFYHSTVAREPTNRGLNADIRQRFAAVLLERFIDAHGGTTTSKDGFIVDASRIRINDLKTSLETLVGEERFRTRAELVIEIAADDASGERMRGIAMQAVKERTGQHIDVPPFRWMVSTYDLDFAVLPGIRPRSATEIQIFISEKSTLGGPSSWGLATSLPGAQRIAHGRLLLNMRVPPGLYRALQELGAATEGTPLSISDNFLRMFYLSAATATTVGYGDIVPLSATSRMLVSLEGILGITLIGFFINSVFVQRPIRTRKPTQADQHDAEAVNV